MFALTVFIEDANLTEFACSKLLKLPANIASRVAIYNLTFMRIEVFFEFAPFV